ncbi:MAG TPA: DUF3592 domain-containing protein [Candidatus Thalassarchaeaceae archaeon]|nr:DUF3592 domain-containing protein [Candidatus Thalassarchaeaceae archaeon]
MNLPDDDDGDYESGFSFEGLTGIEEEPEKTPEQSAEKITATLADFPVDEWSSKKDAQHIVDWYNDLAAKREIEPMSFREFMNMTGNRHFDSINDAQDFLDFALMMLNSSESDREWHHSQTQPGEGTWAGLAIFWVITLVVCTVSVFVTGWIVGAIAADLETDDWTPVDGVITESGVDISQSDEGSNTYCLWVEYDYTIENRTYGGSTLSYTKEGNCDSWSENADADYPPGKNVTVYVNPDNHEEAVLQPGLSGVDFFICCFFIFPLCGILLFGFCCMATYNSFMHPEKYIVGNFVPGDTSTTLPPLDSDEDHTISSGVDLDGDGIADDLFGVEPSTTNKLLDNIFGDVKSPAMILQTLFVLILINGFIILGLASERTYHDEFNVATEAMEGASEWPTTTAWFSENFTFGYSEETGEDYFSGSIIIYCSNTSGSWECGENESGYERIEIPYRCTGTEQVGPLENPCDWAMQMFVADAYHMSSMEDLWIFYDESFHCEWEGEPDDDNLWSCYYSNGESTEYDTWWQYCEHHLNESHWYCTDEFGEEISSPDNQNGTLYQPQQVETTVNYDPDDPTRIAFVEMLEWHTGENSNDIVILGFFFLLLINVIGIGRIAVPLIRKHQAKTSSD